jgi:hypothetical protein
MRVAGQLLDNLSADERWMVRMSYRMMRNGGMWPPEAKRACAALAIGLARG